MLITEALAELKTIAKRVEKKKEAVKGFLVRQDGLKDPLEKDGGSVQWIERELQAISDLNKRTVDIRVAIQRTNLATFLTVEGVGLSITAWLAWRKEVSKSEVAFTQQLRVVIQQARTTATQKGMSVVQVGQAPQAPSDLLVNVNEANLVKTAEHLETVLGTLDGQLSLLNATTQVEGL